jgi:hypothetical protein
VREHPRGADHEEVNRRGRTQFTATDTIHERRECRSCNGFGLVLLDAEYDFETGELTQESIECFICHGGGEVSVYRYATPRRRQ